MLVVHRAASGTALVGALAEVLRTPLDDPFAPDVVAVPAKGVERWLAQRLSHVLGAVDGDGVCANVLFPAPAAVLDDALQAASPEHADAVARWAPRRVAWDLLAVLDGCIGDDWCKGLAQHLGGTESGRRLRVVTRLAAAYARYASARPEMLLAWRSGRDEQGDGTPLPEDLHWQAELWRRLREELGVPSPAELLGPGCERLRREPALAGLPARLSVFGASRLSVARLRVLDALAEHRDVHLWLNHPSPALWDAVSAQPAPRRRGDDVVRTRLRNPLLASLSRDVVELQQSLPPHADVHHATPDPDRTLLQRLKHDLATDSVPTEPRPLDPADDTVQVHACHGRTRQVEVLREAVLGLLAADPTLEPRDVIVMCPDVEAFAPLLAAAFALGDESASVHPAARLRVRIADRSLRQTNPLLAVLATLVALGTGRVTATQLLDLADDPAVRERFGFDDDQVERLRSWVAASGVRWGLDREHRQTWKLGGIGQGTWREGLDRLLLGVAMEEAQGELAGIVPLDDVDSSDIELAGRLAELVARVERAELLLGGTWTAAEWCSGLLDAVLGVAAAPPTAGWQELQLRQELSQVAEDAAGSTAPLTLADVRAVLDPVLAGRPTRSSFRTGTMTVCTLVPMRSVPHRVVCLLGLDDGTFPRQTTGDGDDVLARDPWVGERDPRSEDRQLLLDAIGAAGEHLVVTYTGADERSGATVPPAVPLGELLDAVDRTVAAPAGTRARDLVVRRHPLQPADDRNFALPQPFSFDPLAFAGARAQAAGRVPPSPLLSAPLPPEPAADVALADLARLLDHPARGFLRQRLEVAVPRDEDEPQDALPVDPEGLDTWAVGDRMLRARLTGVDMHECLQRELGRGALPPGALGELKGRSLAASVEAVLAASERERQLPPEALDVDVALADGTRLTGTVSGVRGGVLLSVAYSSLAAKHRLRAWVELVAASAAHPGRELRAVAVGRGKGGAGRSELAPLDADEARVALEELVALYRSGLRAPLPLPVKAAAAYAARRHGGDRRSMALRRADWAWSGDSYPGERAEAEWRLLLGDDAPLDALLGEQPWPEEAGPGWPTDEPDRFSLLAVRLWGRLLDHERLSS
ncbi:DNA helicase/exodeoxyribonuclease V gamma subunit [Motilibacter rhizosphaerae]|uniref:RecBCD enzyme subunit RecC n=1 Tax=Motilibacter rhizosphaerae TaxID=598652 RepID=A0A4Q7NQJ4_9ACTN|nr:exodeoxyribonuclease V subunit gamma [Motilibacter rhizosphaerae]RZS86860.1 DNA helicase/exodeoxyribonuclease V gamma subunit [Motilibacter rhizosphaerae]